MWVRRMAAGFWALIGLAVWANGAQATPYTANLDTDELDAYELKDDQDYQQTFKIFYGNSASVGVDNVTVYLFREDSFGSSRTITAALQTSKNSGVVWSATIQANSVPYDGDGDKDELHAPVTFWGSSVNIDTNTRYWLTLTTNTSGKLWMSYNKDSSYDSPLYSSAHLYEKGSKQSGEDMIFSVPEPSTALMLAWGVVMVSAARRARA